MILQAKQRLTASSHDLNETLSTMTPKQVEYVLDGIDDIYGWYHGDFMHRSATGELLISKAPTQIDLTLVANTMKWLSTFFWPETIKGIKQVYRIHDLFHESPNVGDKVTIRPFKPMLSWTTLPTPRVDRDREDTDVILSLKNPKVLFAVGTFESLAKYELKIDESLLTKKSKPLYEALPSTARSAMKYAKEKEVVVWHGYRVSFKAVVTKVLKPRRAK